MFQKSLSFGGILLLAGVLLTTTSPAHAFGPRGAHFGARIGGAHIGGARFGGYHGGFYHGAYNYRPYYGYRPHYYPAYGYYPYYYNNYPYGYGYSPYADGYYPYYGYSPYYGSYFDDGSWYPSLAGTYSPSYAGGSAAVSPLPATFQGLPRGAQADATAHVTVKVPAGANIWINGSKSDALGSVREFQSPPLLPGYQHTYEFRAQWKNDYGTMVTQTQQVVVSAGDHVQIHFPVPHQRSKQ
jgi:uncharacterized protein (TIGR03000 family)